jgi:hypothetical protein
VSPEFANCSPQEGQAMDVNAALAQAEREIAIIEAR